MRVVVVVTALLVVSAGAWWWAGIPRTPKELYEARCSACHALADLSRRRPEEMVAIIDTMRHRNGAASVIGETEAQEIIGYLKSLKNP
ncbi:MAG: cytochrome c [Rhodospirillales bacterium]|nr:cytochrome c [Rhodospirillales bacterium]MDH3912897.1 cytochrome c [Rhodospirillales bacterium]MDH3967124.1 cytochrome c [Rhodospirillales bacterium]